ncbi:dbp5p [Nannochloropsis oceanica]
MSSPPRNDTGGWGASSNHAHATLAPPPPLAPSEPFPAAPGAPPPMMQSRYGGGGGGARERHRPKYKERELEESFKDSCRIHLPSKRDKAVDGEVVATMSEDDPLHSGVEFSDPTAAIPEQILAAAAELNLEEMSKIQHLTLPMFITDPETPHIIAQANSGSGKSAAFVIGTLALIDTEKTCPQAIILAPNRELVLQAYDWVRQLSKRMVPPLDVALALPDNAAFTRRRVQAHVVVGTPATTLRGIQNRSLDVSHVRIMTLDEADQLLDPKNKVDCERIRGLIEATAPGRSQTGTKPCRYALFSATYSESVMNNVRAFVPHTYKRCLIQLDKNEVMVEEIAQLYVDLRDESGYDAPRHEQQRRKEDFVVALLKERTITGKIVIFVQSKRNCASLADRLRQLRHLEASEFHGGLSPEERDIYFADFIQGRRNVLVATDLLSRGIDVEGIAWVVNFDMPFQPRVARSDEEGSFTDTGAPETYIHRVGRTGRFGAEGIAVSLIGNREEWKLLGAIEKDYSSGLQAQDGELIHRVPADSIAEVEKVAKEVSDAVKKRRSDRLALEAAEELEKEAEKEAAEVAAAAAAAAAVVAAEATAAADLSKTSTKGVEKAKEDKEEGENGNGGGEEKKEGGDE